MSKPYMLVRPLLGLVLSMCGSRLCAEPLHGQPAAPVDANIVATADALRAAARSEDLRAFYEKRAWTPAWTESAITALRGALATRNRHALEHLAFAEPSDSTPAERDVGWTRIALAYSAALARGFVDPESLHSVYTLPRPDIDVRAGLANALAAGTLAQWLAGLAPQDKEYQALSEAYLYYSAQAPKADRTDGAGLIQAGDKGPAVAEIAQALIADGYLTDSFAPQLTPDGQAKYDGQIAGAVKALQRDFGIRADGIVGPKTRAVINIGPRDKARALAVALERRRWLSRSASATRIDVNTAAATLRYYRDGALVDRRKVIVGRPDWATPALRAPIFRLVANPTWTVPKSIERASLSGKSRSYLRRHNMIRRNGYIVQLPGPSNALGLVKFDMHDDQAIYLHDTPNRTLFGRSQRHLSHGCIRVSDALGFASLIAEQEGVSEAWRAARATGKHTFVDLPQPIPVRLLYWNVFVDEGGNIVFRTDPYNLNDPVAEKLGFDAKHGGPIRAPSTDIGP